jgi:hypothetical protein
MIRPVDTARRTLTANLPAEPLTVTVHVRPATGGHCPGCHCQPAIWLGGGAMPPWGYGIVGVGA